MKKQKIDLNKLSDEELINKSIKNTKLSLIFDMIKWGGFIVCMMGTVIAPMPTSTIFTLVNLGHIGIFGTAQVVFQMKCSKCKDILKSRGSLYKYNYAINNNLKQNSSVKKLTKEEIKCNYIFPEFAKDETKINTKNKSEENER